MTEENLTPSPQAPKQPGKAAALAFLGLALAVVLTPVAGMLASPAEQTAENRTLAAAPQLLNEDGSFNVNILSDAGAYFQDHFGFRSELITANASLRAALGSSASTQVVVGENNWLYYAGTLPDYLGQNKLSDRALKNAAHNLRLMQSAVENQGSNFVFTVAPNKNSLYSQNMPYYYLESEEASNWERLVPYLQQYGVNYVDLFQLLSSKTGVQYFTQDTHWNNEGALFAANALLEAMGQPTITVKGSDWITRTDSQGDMAAMLYPVNAPSEKSSYAPGINDGAGLSGSSWSYLQGSAVTDNTVATAGQGAQNFVVFRDSFGNALLPYLATASAHATFSKLLPYNELLVADTQASCVIVERAERNIAYLAQSAPFAYAPVVQYDQLPAIDDPYGAGTTLTASVNGPLLVLDGVLDKRMENLEAGIYVAVEGPSGQTIYEAFTTSPGLGGAAIDSEGQEASNTVRSDYGFTAYLNAAEIDLTQCTVRVFAVANGVCYGAKTFHGAEILV